MSVSMSLIDRVLKHQRQREDANQARLRANARRKATLASILWTAFGLPEPKMEFRFHPDRMWRFDYFWEAEKVALEVEGGAWVRGRHTRGKGFISDIAKYNAAAEMGIRVFRCTPLDMKNGNAAVLMRRVLLGK